MLVQSPQTARFGAMPRSAIDAGLADMVAPAAQLPAKVLAYFAHPMMAENRADPETRLRADALQAALEKVLILVRTQTGHDFSLYKKGTIYRRIQRRARCKKNE